MEYAGLKFDQTPRQRFLTRTTWVVGLVIGLVIAWNTIPHTTLIWLLIPVIAGLGWVASHGWRVAIKIIGRYINRVEQW